MDLETGMEILAGVQIKPSLPLEALDTKIGKAISPNFTSTIISVNLSKAKLQQLGLGDQELFFQAAAIPVGNTDPIAASQVSECDRYLIAHIVEGEDGEEGMTGGKSDPDDMSTGGGGTQDNGKMPM
ncbi:MAG: hypothetical protein DRR19_01585 [Candidatus Parabeggiatoa sp. nov. 1]|nr:MAG: hypothetical protein DRR19_01585 [Gammaproteobacteria bacterium]